jgi:hypothetical protein
MAASNHDDEREQRGSTSAREKESRVVGAWTCS